MDRRDRLESRIALAMLPIGGTMTIVSVVAFVAIVLLGIDTLARRPEAAGWLLGWCVAALGVAMFNIRRSIEVMSAFDWRALVPVMILSIAIVAAYPAWWL